MLLRSRFAGRHGRARHRRCRRPTLKVMGNRIRLEQVLINLLQNALEALDGREGDQARRDVGREATADGVTLTVADNGPGISPKIREVAVHAVQHLEGKRPRARTRHLARTSSPIMAAASRLRATTAAPASPFICRRHDDHGPAAPVVLSTTTRICAAPRAQTLELAGFSVSAFATAAKAALAGLDAGLCRRRRDRHPHARDRRPAALRPRQGDGRRPAGHPGHRPWRHRDGRSGDQGRRLRLHRQAFRRRPAGAERAAREREAPAGDGEPGACAQAAEQAQDGLPLIGQTPAMERLRRHAAAHRRYRCRRAGRPARPAAARRWSRSLCISWSRRAQGQFRGAELRRAAGDRDRERTVRPRGRRLHRRAEAAHRPHRACERRHAVPRRDRKHAGRRRRCKMLRVLEMREITPLGTNEVRPVDLRVVAAAKIDLGDPGQRGDFREDLYYRLNVVTISIPPLRERRDDIPLLFFYFAERAAARFRRRMPAVPAAVHRHLCAHDWPGNVRELSHFAERVVLGLGGGGASAGRPPRRSRTTPARCRNGWNATRPRSSARRLAAMTAMSAARSRRSAFRARRSTTSCSATASCAAISPNSSGLWNQIARLTVATLTGKPWQVGIRRFDEHIGRLGGVSGCARQMLMVCCRSAENE